MNNHRHYHAVCAGYMHLVRAVIGQTLFLVRPIILIFLSIFCSLGFVCSFVGALVYFLTRSSFRSMTSSKSCTQSVHLCVSLYVLSFVCSTRVRSFVRSFLTSLFMWFCWDVITRLLNKRKYFHNGVHTFYSTVVPLQSFLRFTLKLLTTIKFTARLGLTRPTVC